MYTLFAVSLDADSRVGYLSIALHKYSQSLLSAVPVLYCHLAASLVLWEGEDPEIPLEPTRKRRAKASAGRQGVQAPCYSGVQDWAQPPIIEAREAKINPSVLVAKNWWWWPRCHSGMFRHLPGNRGGIKIRTFTWRKALKKWGNTWSTRHQNAAGIRGSGKDWSCNSNFKQAEMGKRNDVRAKVSGQYGDISRQFSWSFMYLLL